jgi:hypothetical protein
MIARLMLLLQVVALDPLLRPFNSLLFLFVCISSPFVTHFQPKMSDSDSDAGSSSAPAVSAVASASGSSAAPPPPSSELAALRAARKVERAAAKAAKKAARPPPEVHLKNVPMLLVTCDGMKEPMAKKEMLAWMNDYAERHYPRAAAAAADSADAPAAASVSSGLEAELAALQAEAAAERQSFRSSSTAAADSSRALGVRFNIVEMVRGMIDEVKTEKAFRTRSGLCF